jgi:hypothetical protein
MYQRLLAYSAHKGRKSQLLGVVHAIDPGDAKGPGTTTDATLNAGILQTSNPNNLVYFNRIANIEPGVLEPQEFMPVLNGFVAPELVELDETHTKETAVPFKDRPNVSAVLKAANTARQLGAIVFNGDQNRRV